MRLSYILFMQAEHHEETYVEYYLGDTHKEVLLDAPHAYGKQQDLYTGSLVRATVDATDCNAIVGKISRTEADLNRSLSDKNFAARHQYQEIVHQMLADRGLLEKSDSEPHASIKRPVLHLGIHGMKDEHVLDIEFGNRFGESCSTEVLAWLLAETYAWRDEEESLPVIRIGYNEKFTGDPSISFFRNGASGQFEGYGEKFHTIQIEFSRTLREHHHDALVSLLKRFTEGFQNQEFARV